MRTLATLALLLTMSSTPRTPSGQPGPMQPSDYTPAAPPNVVSWQVKRLPPPSRVYITRDDVLAVIAKTNLANTTISVTARVLLAQGTIQVIQRQDLVPNDSAVHAFTYPVAEGFLLSVTLSYFGPTPTAPAIYGSVSIARGAPPNTLVYETLVAGYVDGTHGISWPDYGVQRIGDGPGLLRSVSGAAPAAGADISFALPTGVYWDVIALTMQFTASAVVANRFPRLRMFDGALNMYTGTAAAAITASQVILVSGGQGVNLLNDGQGAITLPLPTNLRMVGGWSFRTSTVGIAAGDQWSAPQFLVKEWLVGG